MKTNLLLLSVFFFSSGLAAQWALPDVKIDSVTRLGNSLSIYYTYAQPGNAPATLRLRAGAKDGAQLNYNTGNATGDLGPGILPGTHQLQWDFSAYGKQDFRLQLIAEVAQPLSIQELVNAVDSNSLKAYIAAIEGVRHRNSNPAHLQQVKDLLQAAFEDAGLESQLHNFDYGGYTASNIIGKKTGLSDETQVYILDGHYDTLADAPGADDNGSAVAGMLEALRILSQFEFDKSIKFIGFDLEEAGTGLVGSKRYVDEQLLPPEQTAGVINLEMIGYYTNQPNTQSTPPGFATLFPQAHADLAADEFRGNFIINTSYKNSLALAQAFNQAAAQYVPELKVVLLHAESLLPDLLRSDHAWFWFKGIPALMITDGAEFRNPHYHSPEDKSEYLNFTFMRQVVQAALATLATEAGIRNADAEIFDTEFFPSATSQPFPCSVRLSPNPLTGKLLSVSFSDCTRLPKEVHWALFNAFGQALAEGHLHKSGQINLAQMPAGLYFLRLRNGQAIQLLRFVKV